MVTPEPQVLSAMGINAQTVLDGLVAQAKAKHAATHTGTDQALMPSAFLDGYYCIDKLAKMVAAGEFLKMFYVPWCAADTRDTAYISQLPPSAMDKEDFVWVFGVNHAATGMATYMNVSANHPQSASGVVSMLNSQLEQSADHLLPTTSSPYFYALKLARTCPKSSDELCMVVPDSVPLDDAVMVTVRAYLNPKTKVAPAYTDLVMPRAVVFEKK